MSPLLLVGVVAVLVAAVVVVLVLRSGSDDDAVTGAPDTTAASAGPTTEPDTTDTPSTSPAPTTASPSTAPPTTEPDGPLTPSDLATRVVQIQLLLNGQAVCSGSGTILDPQGTILTNSHVIAQSAVCPHDQIGVAIVDVAELPPILLFEADVLVDDPALDLAVIRVARTLTGGPVPAEFPFIEVGDSDALALGDQLRVIGFPGIGGETVTFTEGTISGFVTVPGIGDRGWLKTDATLAGGNSGGLAADSEGRLVGIPTIVGTGEGRFVDCRFVEDTNMDGVIDENDQCVPVGGFINGIRPVNLALPLIEAAATAEPMQRSGPMVDSPLDPDAIPFAFNPVWSFDVVDGFPSAPTGFVPSGTTQLCLTWEYENVQAGAAFEVLWFLDGEFDPGPTATGTVNAEAGGFFACVTNPNGLVEGLYDMAWVVDDQPVFIHAIFVGEDRREFLVTVVNETDTPICLLHIAPSRAATFGLNLLDAPIPPGGSRTFTFAEGFYDERIIDCDGNVFIEETQSLILDNDVTITLTVN